MIKMGWIENMTNFLQMSDKLSSKKRRQINKNKQKTSIRKTYSRKFIIDSFDNFDKKKLSVPLIAIKTSKSMAKNINIAIISADTYYATCYCKRA